MFWNCIVENLPLDAEELYDFQLELENKTPREHVPRSAALLMLLYRCADIADTLAIKSLVWPYSCKDVALQWKLKDPRARTIRLLFIEEPNHARQELVELWTHDKELINDHLNRMEEALGITNLQDFATPDSMSVLLDKLEGLYFVPDSNILEHFHLTEDYDPENDHLQFLDRQDEEDATDDSDVPEHASMLWDECDEETCQIQQMEHMSPSNIMSSNSAYKRKNNKYKNMSVEEYFDRVTSIPTFQDYDNV